MSEAQPTIAVQLNGESRELAANTSLAALLDQLGVPTNHVAVEVNRQLVPRAMHAAHLLQDGDLLEVVTLVGGG